MATFELRDAMMDITAESTVAVTYTERTRAFYELLKTWSNNVDIESVKLELDSGTIYKFRVDHNDGRVLKEDWDIAVPADPTIDNKPGDPWKLSEFSHMRGLRDELVYLLVTYQITSVVVEFNGA